MQFSRLIIATALVAAGASQHVDAQEFHVGAVYSADQLWGGRIGLRSDDYAQTLLPDSWLSAIGNPTIAFEGALNQWQDSNDSSDKLTALTLSPVFQWQIAGEQRPLYVEAGIGVSVLDGTTIGDRNLSIHFQFEDRLALSWQYSSASKARISLAYTHYSQADLDRPNDGLDFFSINWHIPFG
ncbi:acyloxyacyl hydrolase [Pseudidiomarina aquimaris]|uniref:Acyloxyacyl hydrolase n=1 Tax=Pseudidiomarina aquimaris TaxID=641841 RepID=A0A432XAY6_9GAMM|nr:acyloxyacyl hydrolase [Pseudidiomarina aquimaris]RUO45855.1 acyloxyacyl hydrolase [Pseudidiomarina aquimaris]